MDAPAARADVPPGTVDEVAEPEVPSDQQRPPVDQLESAQPARGVSSASTSLDDAVSVTRSADPSAPTDDEAARLERGLQSVTPEDATPQTAAVGPEPLDGPEEAIWRAVGKGRIGIAYHVAKLARATGSGTAHPTPELLEAVALGVALRGPEDDFANAFAQQVGPLSGLSFEACDPPLRDALNLLLFAASLRPALFSAQNGVGIRLLRRVKFSGGLAPVRSLANVVAACAEKLQGAWFDVDTLTGLLDEGLWSDRIDEHRELFETWRAGAVSATFIYAPAGAVWQELLSSRGVLGELTRLLTTGTTKDTQRIREIVDEIGNQKAVRDLIEYTDQRLRPQGERIVAGAHKPA